MQIPWWGVVPFVALLACIATLPLFERTGHLWERRGFQLAVALSLGGPVAVWMWAVGEHAAVIHALVEYVQFVTLLGSLYVVSGGIALVGDLRATPRNNTLFLAFGALIASFVGTTGAAMLLIRPLLNTNSERAYKVHTVVFAIFTVANCGGLLTPLGDPPLFLGMLRGVPFNWTFTLFWQWLFVNGLLLGLYYALDRLAYSREAPAAIEWDAEAVTPLRVRGTLNFVLLAAVVAAVAFAPSLDLHAIEEGHADWTAFVPWRELGMLAAAAASYFGTSRTVRFVTNKFDWAPMQEVAALFVGIFLAMIPALKVLAEAAPKLPLNELTFFVFTGGLSALLDNAPTYATFFEMAATLPGDPRIAGVPASYLTSISLGAVFCGATTYIGNGPNFMVKSIAESARVAMPSFGGYLLWSGRYLVPVLAAMACLFIADGWVAKGLGVLIILGYAGVAVSLVRRSRQGVPAG